MSMQPRSLDTKDHTVLDVEPKSPSQVLQEFLVAQSRLDSLRSELESTNLSRRLRELSWIAEFAQKLVQEIRERVASQTGRDVNDIEVTWVGVDKNSDRLSAGFIYADPLLGEGIAQLKFKVSLLNMQGFEFNFDLFAPNRKISTSLGDFKIESIFLQRVGDLLQTLEFRTVIGDEELIGLGYPDLVTHGWNDVLLEVNLLRREVTQIVTPSLKKAISDTLTELGLSSSDVGITINQHYGLNFFIEIEVIPDRKQVVIPRLIASSNDEKIHPILLMMKKISEDLTYEGFTAKCNLVDPDIIVGRFSLSVRLNPDTTQSS